MEGLVQIKMYLVGCAQVFKAIKAVKVEDHRGILTHVAGQTNFAVESQPTVIQKCRGRRLCSLRDASCFLQSSTKGRRYELAPAEWRLENKMAVTPIREPTFY